MMIGIRRFVHLKGLGGWTGPRNSQQGSTCSNVKLESWENSGAIEKNIGTIENVVLTTPQNIHEKKKQRVEEGIYQYKHIGIGGLLEEYYQKQ